MNGEAGSMRVCVLDCAGFIGSRLLGRLLERPDVEIVGVAADYRPISQYLSHERLTFYGGDVPPQNGLMRQLVERSDVCVNLLSTADARHHRDNVNTILDVDLPASLALARDCARNGVRLVHISTGDVFNGIRPTSGPPGRIAPEPSLGTVTGTSPESAQLQGGTPVDACALYASGKRLEELGVQTSGRALELDYTILRVFNPGGPGSEALAEWCPRHPGPLLAQLAQGIARNWQMTFSVHPDDVYTYVHIDDVANAIMRVILDPPPGASHELFNVGNPENVITPATLARRLFALFAERTGAQSQATVTWEPPEQFGPARLIPDVAATRAVLGWEPTRSLDDILGGAINGVLATRWDRGRR